MGRRAVAVWLGLVVGLAGCAAAAPSTDAAATESASQTSVADDRASGEVPDACELLTAGEIESVVGNPVGEGVASTGSDCSWADDPDATSVALLLLDTGASACESALGADEDQQPVEGHGVPAFWTWIDASGGVGTLSLCTDGAGMATVTVSGGLDDESDEAGLRAQAEALADLILDRL